MSSSSENIDAQSYAEGWIAEWNRRDLAAILGHYRDDVVLRSPRAATVVPASGGVIRGKAALEQYWTVALAAVPDLHFTLLDVYEGVDTVVISYVNQAGGRVLESLRFGGLLVVEASISHVLDVKG
jgi:ketosteroid isomerase-like protein